MALTTEQQALRRRIIRKNIQRGMPDADEYFDRMMEGGDYCMEQLEIWAAIFANEEAKLLEEQAKELLERAAAKRAELAFENNPEL